MENTISQAKNLGFEQQEVSDLVESLNNLLANYQIHYQKLRNFHWNVKGPDFFELHEQFEQEYNAVKLNIDVLAERIRIFGARPLSTLSEYLSRATIKEQKEHISSEEMVAEIISDYENLLTNIVNGLELAATAGDSASHNMLTQWSEQIEKRHWMFTAWLS